jgi:hypothetical protein
MVGAQVARSGAGVDLGMLMPALSSPKKDREIFLKILTMDDDSTWQRCKSAAPLLMPCPMPCA